MKNGYFLEYNTAKVGYQGDFQAAKTGARVSMNGVDKITILIAVDTGVGTSALEVALQQHNAMTGGTPKDLKINNSYYYKTNAQAVFTQVKNQDPETEFSTVTVAGLATAAGILAIDVNAEDLDVNNKYFAISANLAAAGAARSAAVMYIAGGLSFGPAYKHSI